VYLICPSKNNQVAEVVANRGKRSHFPWNPGREFTLVNHIFLEKGQLRTDTNMIDKFNNISCHDIRIRNPCLA
jgi:hypothetical protein